MKKLVVALTALIFLFPSTTSALLGLPFGGKVVSTVPCPCSGGMVITFTPFYGLGISIPLASTLYYNPVGARPYANFTPGIPSSWMMGSYTPGAAYCGIPDPTLTTPCPPGIPLPFPVPMGTIREFGASFPTL